MPGTVSDVRFAHSPGRLDPAYLGNLVAFDVAFVLDLGDGTQGIVGVDDRVPRREQAAAAEAEPAAAVPRDHRDVRRASARARSTRSTGRTSSTSGSSTCCVLSMLQHPSGAWRWGRLVVVHPAGNTDFADACTPLPGAPRRRVDLRLRDRRRAPRCECSPDGRGIARSVHGVILARRVLGGLLVLTGVVWLGQGLGLIHGSSMTGSTFWAVVGAVCFVAGLGLLSWPWREA